MLNFGLRYSSALNCLRSDEKDSKCTIACKHHVLLETCGKWSDYMLKVNKSGYLHKTLKGVNGTGESICLKA